ncbi:UNVERIFIED_CONTAM: hypothetical protein FKN15_034388 [Acipenser sinensis]
MSASAVASCATSILCCSQGSLDYRQLYKRVCKYHTITEQLFCQILRNGSRFAIVEGTEGNIPGCELSDDTTIIAKTSVRLCKQYRKEDCADCNGLHLCRYFVCGNCRFDKERNKCRNSHDLHSVHNSNILRANQLQGLQEAELSQLLLQNDPSLLPEVCAHYNKGNGEYGSCTFKTKCTKLHICQHFLQGNCKFGQQCKRSHKFDANAQKMLEGRGLSTELISNLPSIYYNIYTINCSTGSSAEKCVRVHFHLPYKWEVYNGLTWKDLPNMEEIEKDYCDPENTTRQKEQMKKKNGGESVDEKFLFHGTEQSLLDAICEQNFDWRICGVHGSLYGKGSYFARDASYSHNYSKTRTGTQILFVARVLVGEFTRGKSNYVRPPPKDGSNTSFYNSCVDSKSNPSIFVIFEKHQIYPEYLIEYH